MPSKEIYRNESLTFSSLFLSMLALLTNGVEKS